MTTGEKIREARKTSSLTQIQLSSLSGVSVNSIRLYEADKRIPKIEILNKLAKALDTEAVLLVDSFSPVGVEAWREYFSRKDLPNEAIIELRENNETVFTVTTGGRLDRHFREYLSLIDEERRAVDVVTETFSKNNKKAPDFSSGENVN